MTACVWGFSEQAGACVPWPVRAADGSCPSPYVPHGGDCVPLAQPAPRPGVAVAILSIGVVGAAAVAATRWPGRPRRSRVARRAAGGPLRPGEVVLLHDEPGAGQHQVVAEYPSRRPARPRMVVVEPLDRRGRPRAVPASTVTRASTVAAVHRAGGGVIAPPTRGRHDPGLTVRDYAYVDSQGGRHLRVDAPELTRVAMGRWTSTHFESPAARAAAARRIVSRARRQGIHVNPAAQVARAAAR